MDIENQAPQQPTSVNVINPLGDLVSIPASQLQSAIQQGYAHATPDVVDQYKKEAEYGTLGQQTIAGLEGIARGATLGASDVIEPTLFGTTKEAIKARKEVNPGTSLAGNIVGGAGLIGLTGGLAAPAEAALGGAGLGATLLATGAEGALFGAGSAVSDAALGDPDLNAQKVVADVGLGALMGVGAGLAGHGLKSLAGRFGVKGSLPEAFAKEAGSANESAETARAVEALSQPGLKSGAPEVMEAAERLNLPVMNGMVSESPWVQKAESALLNGAPTYSAIKRANLYAEGYNGAINALESVVPEQALSKAQTGSVIQDGLVNKIAEESRPISELYNTIKQTSQEVPLSERSAPRIAKNIMEMQEVKLSPSSPEARLATRVADEIANLKTVDDIKAYRAILNRSVSPTASSGEKRILAVLSDKLQDLEENTITRHAEKFLDEFAALDPEAKINFQSQADRYSSLLQQKKEAAAIYKPFIEKVSTLAEQLGKKRVYGPQDAINFIRDLDVEQVANRLSKKDASQFRNFFEKTFPEENAVLRDYQRNALREAASKNGEFNPKTFFKKFNDLEPEMQKSLFSPDEIQKIKDAETYIRAIPKDFNPSGTAGMSAFREFFKSPTGALAANARDFGIEQFIRTMGALPENVRPNPYEVGTEMAQRFNRLNAARNFMDRTDKAIRQNAKAIFGGAVAASTYGIKDHLSYEQKIKRIQDLADDPDVMSEHIAGHVDGISQDLPQTSQALAMSLSTSIGFLASKVPKPRNDLPFNGKWAPSNAQKQKFNTYYNAVIDPVSVMDLVRRGSLTSESMEALKATHPSLLQEMQKNLIDRYSREKAMKLPQSVRRSISMFMGTPLEDGMLPQVIQANQATFQMPNQAQNQAKTPKSTVGGLKELDIAGRSRSNTYREEIEREV